MAPTLFVETKNSAWKAVAEQVQLDARYTSVIRDAITWLNEQHVDYTLLLHDAGGIFSPVGRGWTFQALELCVELGDRDAVLLKIAVPKVVCRLP